MLKREHAYVKSPFKSQTLSPEQAAEALASIKEDKDQAKRMRAIATQIMTRDAAAGVWFAIGRALRVANMNSFTQVTGIFCFLTLKKVLSDAIASDSRICAARSRETSRKAIRSTQQSELLRR